MQGPLKFKIVSFDDSNEREIHADFKQDFQKLSIEEQATQFSEHVRSLQSQADKLEQESQERQGILFVLQFLQELEPRIRAGDIPLHETIIVKVMEQPPLNKLISDLKIN